MENGLLKAACNMDKFWSPCARSTQRLRAIRFPRITIKPRRRLDWPLIWAAPEPTSVTTRQDLTPEYHVQNPISRIGKILPQKMASDLRFPLLISASAQGPETLGTAPAQQCCRVGTGGDRR
jgi:hypothetical protein